MSSSNWINAGWILVAILICLSGFKISIKGNSFVHIGLLEQILNHLCK